MAKEHYFMSTELQELIRLALGTFSALPPEEQAKLKREQAIEFALGNLTCTGRRPYITRKLIEEQYDKLYGDKK